MAEKPYRFDFVEGERPYRIVDTRDGRQVFTFNRHDAQLCTATLRNLNNRAAALEYRRGQGGGAAA